ncbi:MULTISPECIES: hypothetical protein [Prochlorococcus]|uniref:hypothetical protein n=1 Tax=Prochlorococcus TaxID=1218 RepID=UPI000533A518|nr:MULTISPECIES: hypothetical protein [Prochlorococcus]KGG12943.1 putative Arenavirus glycoprotein [Prochlorococcus sp. MIT 0601]
MNSTKTTELLSSRKDWLQNQISQATIENNKQLLSVLEAQWVHRYGLETLHETDLKDATLHLPKNFPSDINQLDKSTSGRGSSEKSLIKDSAKVGFQLSSQIQEETLTQNVIELEDKIDRDFIDEASKDLSEVDGLITNREEQIEQSIIEAVNISAPPPPPPSISHLRRWLPSILDRNMEAS